MHLGPLRMPLRAPIGFFLLLGPNSSPEKVQHFLVSPNSIKIVPNGMFFGAATGSGVLLCWGRCTKTSTFLRDPPHPSQNGFFHLIDKIADFLHSKTFFSDSPKGFALLLGQCAALRSLAQLTTPFLASGKAKNGVFFPNDRTYRAFLHNKLFFLIAPRDLRYYKASAQPCAALQC